MLCSAHDKGSVLCFFFALLILLSKLAFCPMGCLIVMAMEYFSFSPYVNSALGTIPIPPST